MNISANPYNQINNATSNQAFGAVRVDKVKLLKNKGNGVYKAIKGNVLELDPYDAKDKKIINKIRSDWKRTEYAHSICDNFFDQENKTDRFFAIQTKKGFKKQITNLMQLDIALDEAVKKLKVCIKYLQSAPNIANKLTPDVKGSGEVALYEAVKIADKNKANSVFLFSTNDAFYEKAGLSKEFEIANCSLYNLTEEKFVNFLNRVKEKYNF